MQTTPVDRAAILLEALPWIQQWTGKVVVIKFGGSAMKDPALARAVVQDLVLLRQVGVKVVLVHGGGPAVSGMAERLGIVSTFQDGLRVTPPEMMEVAQMVQVGLVGRSVLASIARFGGKGIGLSGHDGGGWLRADKRTHTDNCGKPVDLGRVGDITHVEPGLVRDLLDDGFIPVIAPVAVDGQLEALNVNADSVAAAVARAMKAEKLIFLTDVAGISGPGGVMERLSSQEVLDLIQEEVISGGMVPKALACVEAVRAGVGAVVIADGRAPHSLVVELLTERGSGTLVSA